MVYKRPAAPDSPATRSTEQPSGDRREDGEADVLDVPQADGDSGENPDEVERPVEVPAKLRDNRANGWRGR